jgi:signal recognition particle receptor subunit alpha
MLLDFFCIFSTGGLILWFKQFVNCKYESLINYIIKTILLDQKRTIDSLSINGTVLRWKISDENNLIFIVAYQEAYSLLYVDRLVLMVMNDFLRNEITKISKHNNLYFDGHDFSKRFMEILNSWENDCNKILIGGEEAKLVKDNYKSKRTNQSEPKDRKKKDSIEALKEKNNEENNNISTSKSAVNLIKSSEISNLNSNIPKSVQMKRMKSQGKGDNQTTTTATTTTPGKKQKEKTQKQEKQEYSKKLENELNM